jgi:hypothetical protein
MRMHVRDSSHYDDAEDAMRSCAAEVRHGRAGHGA